MESENDLNNEIKQENQNENQDNTDNKQENYDDIIKPQVEERTTDLQEPQTKSRSSSINKKDNVNDYFRVVEPITKDGIKKFTCYKIECSLIQGPVFKRYSDFDILRAKLLERWPGLYIPNIPPKKMVGNLESSFIESRCLQLREFCSKICEMSYLFKSEEVRIFLLSEDVEKALNRLPKESPEETLMKYKKSFINIIKDNQQTNVDEEITKCTGFMTKVLVRTLSTLKVSIINNLSYNN